MDLPWLISPISLLLFPLIIITFLKLFLTTKTRSNLPPGPPKLSIIGNLHQLATNKTPPPQRLQELARTYGPIMHLRLGEISTVVVSSAEVAKQVMRTHDANFANRPKFFAGRVLYYDYSDIGLAPYGEYWRQVRKIATLELFTGKRVQSFRAIREDEVATFVKTVAASAGSVVNLSSAVFGLIFNITSRTAFSKAGESEAAFKRLVRQISEVTSGFAIEDLYPSMKLIHSFCGMKKTLSEMVVEADRILDPIIKEHKSNTRKGVEENLVDVLMKFHEENPDNHSGFTLSTDNIKGILLEIFGAGTETSSTTIMWIMSELLKNPKVMEKAQKEVRKVYKGNGIIDEESLDELKYLKSVIKETLRLHPPVPLLVPRESMEPCQIQGYTLPSKTRVIVNAYAIARDPLYWPEPNRFWPERFENSLVDYKGKNFELIPFGAGRRMCPGMTLGVVNVELPLAMLLYHFDWKLPNGIESQDLDMDDLFGITMGRKNELCVIPVPFISSHTTCSHN